MAWVSCTGLSSAGLASCAAVLAAVVFPLGDAARDSGPVELGWCAGGRSAAAYDHRVCNGRVPVLIFLLHRCCWGVVVSCFENLIGGYTILVDERLVQKALAAYEVF
jgi:hypothetical protein